MSPLFTIFLVVFSILTFISLCIIYAYPRREELQKKLDRWEESIEHKAKH